VEEQLISFETAKLAKEKGFAVPNKMVYSEHGGIFERATWPFNDYQEQSIYAIPTQSLLQKWLRDEHELFVWVEHGAKKTHDVLIGWSRVAQLKGLEVYEDALEAGLFKALKMLKNTSD